MTVTVLRDRDRVATPWKNGGGVTREVAVWPPGASFDDFDWRISLARVEAAGPFSAFPGIDRTLAVIEGALTLSMADGTVVTVDPKSDPVRFAGETSMVAGTPAGPVTDFNVMSRRGRAVATVDRLTDGGPVDGPATGWTVILACDRTELMIDGRGVVLERFDGLMITPRDARPRLVLARAVHILLARITGL